MKIVSVESKTGLDRATIRYYEKEGLVNPKRMDNGYRDYSDEDLNHLMKIKLLRQLGMPLERIRNLQQGSEDFSSALLAQLRILDAKIAAAQRAKDVCQEMINDQVSYATLNPAVYFDRLNAQTSSKAPAISKDYHEPAATEPYHPFRRFFARMLDYLILRYLLLFIVTVILRVRPVSGFVTNLISYGAPILVLPLAAMFLSRTGTTPGKWLMGLGVDSINGGRLQYSEALDREWCALWYGYGLGIPIWSLVLLYKSMKSYKDKPLDWDYCSEYIYRPWSFKRKIALFVAVIAIIFLILVPIMDLIKPHYRGDLTISEFASNYNDYLEQISENPSNSEYLLDNGRWAEEIGNVIVVGTKSEDNDFTYVTEGDIITGIQYDNTWTEIFGCDPLSGKAEIAAITLLMSQKATDIQDLYKFNELWRSMEGDKSGSITYENIEIRWEIDAVNCYDSTDGRYFCVDQEMESSVTLHFELIVH